MLTTILILGPFTSQALSCAKMIRHYANNVKIIGGVIEQTKIYSKYSRYYDRLEHINDKSQLSSFDVIVPASASSVKFVFSNQEQIMIGKIPMNAEILRTFNKPSILNLSETLGVPIPQTWQQIEEIPSFFDKVFVKPTLEGEIGMRRPMLLEQLRERKEFQDGFYIFQEIIQGQGTYGFGFLAKEGKVLASSTHYEIFSFPSNGGSASVIELVADPRLVELSEKLLKELNYNGYGLVEYKWCPSRKDYVLMEINSKLWASIELALRTNPEFGRLLFGLDVKKETLNGLVWPDRLLASGLKQFWKARRYIKKFSMVIEPITLQKIMQAREQRSIFG